MSLNTLITLPSRSNIYYRLVFTTHSLNPTSLYYYNTRYYDPLIGGFISPDTIVPLPSNPQSFNRYSYCLNNPLKYIDPSGHDVYIPGLGDVESITMESYIWLMHMTPEARGEVIAILGGYNSFRESSNIYAAWAKTMETSQEHNVIIQTGDLGFSFAAETKESGDDYIITLNTNRGNSFFEGETFQQGWALKDQISDNILITRPDFNNYTNWSNIFGMLPIIGTPGKIINSWQTFWGTMDDIYQIKQGNLSWSGLTIDIVSYSAMFYPPTMVPACIYQFTVGAIRAQDAFDAYHILVGGYDFK
jgi:RHS repeat-associated protein